MKKLRIYGGNLDGRNRVVLACSSLAEFRRVTRIGRNYCNQTWNPEEVAMALSSPGTLFVRRINARYGDAWEMREPV